MTQSPPSATPSNVEIYEPAQCCSTGVCGPDVDEALVHFVADAAWANGQGYALTRRNLAQEPLAFAQNPVVAGMLQVTGPSILPLTLLNGQVALAGRYPTRAELTRWLSVGRADVPLNPSLTELSVTQPAGCSCPDGAC